MQVEVVSKIDSFSTPLVEAGGSVSSRFSFSEEASNFLGLVRWLVLPPKPLAVQTQGPKMNIAPSDMEL